MKNRNIYRFLIFIFIFAAIMCGCSEAPAETTVPTEDPNLKVTALTMTVSGADELGQLSVYPNLEKLDLRGSTCYDAIMAYASAHPQVEVIYDVSIGDTSFDCTVESLTLESGSFSFGELIENLKYLPNAASVSLPETDLSCEMLSSLPQAYPNITFTYSVNYHGQIIPGDTRSLDLSSLTSDQLEEAALLLEKLPDLAEVALMDEQGASLLTMSDVKLLMDAAPEAVFHYTFSVFGRTLSTTDERIDFSRIHVGNEGVSLIRQALDIMPNCTYFLMEQCGVDNETMDRLNRDYPDTQVVWRVNFGSGYSSLTDATVVRCVGDLNDYNSVNLKYMTEVVYLDAGHCYALTDLSFVAYMPNLKVAIFSDCGVSDLTPFASCQKLEYIEIVNCNRLKEITPLGECVSLKGVNMSWVFSVEELDPLYGLENLERLYFGRHDFPQEEIDEARAALPNCWITDHAESVAWISFNYSVGWRLDDEHTFAEWYKEIKEVFGYEREIY